jgi:hypothetical protein
VRTLEGWFTRPLLHSIQWTVKMQFQLLFNKTVASELFTTKYFTKTILLYISLSEPVTYSVRPANIMKQIMWAELDVLVPRAVGSNPAPVFLFIGTHIQ